MATFQGIGVMSGTSLDGLDLCWTEFTGDVQADIWSYRIEKAKTIPYSDNWRTRLKHATELSGEELIRLHVDFGHFVGKTVRDFITEGDLKVDFVASHGHTVFHQPQNGFTFQLGDGETTSIYLPCPYVTNFRAKDLALGGQGAPLAPSGEFYLFRQTDICINLGGIANIGLRGSKGYDIAPCNILFNKLAKMWNSQLEYDKDGIIASSGVVNTDLLLEFDDLDYYKLEPPKSLGIEWIQKNIFPLLNTDVFKIPDIMRTFTEHLVNKIIEACKENSTPKAEEQTCTVLFTGGGALNKFLMKLIEERLEANGITVVEADEDTINYKEALLFAFLGLRCLLGLENIKSEITGSSMDSISGTIHRPVYPSNSCCPTLHDRFNHLMKQSSTASDNIPPKIDI